MHAFDGLVGRPVRAVGAWPPVTSTVRPVQGWTAPPSPARAAWPDVSTPAWATMERPPWNTPNNGMRRSGVGRMRRPGRGTMNRGGPHRRPRLTGLPRNPLPRLDGHLAATDGRLAAPGERGGLQHVAPGRERRGQRHVACQDAERRQLERRGRARHLAAVLGLEHDPQFAALGSYRSFTIITR